MNYVGGQLNGSLQFTDTDDSHVVSYNVVSGTLNVTHTGDVWTFALPQRNISYISYGSTSYWSATAIVDITFG